jgi:hydroxymethylpyrimidine kinase/phosphomethylpyrimidine kinase
VSKILLSLAGFDPSSGAGVSLDLSVFAALGFPGMGVLTSLTAQNTSQVRKVLPVSAKFLWLQYSTLRSDVTFAGLKIGMLGTAENIRVVSRILKTMSDKPRVIDPVLRSSSGAWLLEKKHFLSYISAIKGKASVLTPNLDEAELIAGIRVAHVDDMKEAARRITDRLHFPCLVKGGHLPGRVFDVLFDGKAISVYEKERIGRGVHGTGCLFSSSLLCYLVKKNSLALACELAGRFTHLAIKNSIRVGRGRYVFSFS